MGLCHVVFAAIMLSLVPGLASTAEWRCSPIIIHNDTSSPNFTFDFYNDTFHHNATIQEMKRIIYVYIIRFICMFGLVGNLLNLVVLTRKSLTTHMERMEKSAHVGLIALAVSDFLFCLAVIPSTFKPTHMYEYPSPHHFWLVYELYNNAAINTFLLSSTWLTVAMAVSRYLAICYPLKARQHLGMKAARYVICLVFVFTFVFNLPRFWMNAVESDECDEGWQSYYSLPGPMETNVTAKMVYRWMYFVFGIFLPLVLLIYCNIYLIKALQKSTQLRRQITASGKKSTKDSVSNSTNIVTLTLTIIVVFYIVLVSPAEVLSFWETWIKNNFSEDVADSYSLAVSICNALQAANFAMNFILYCIINVHFRKVVRELITCMALREQIHRQLEHSGSSSDVEAGADKAPVNAPADQHLLPTSTK